MHLDDLAVAETRKLRCPHAHHLAARAHDGGQPDQRRGAVAVDQQGLDLIAGDLQLAADLAIAFQHGSLAVALAEEREHVDRPLHQPVDVVGDERHHPLDVPRGRGAIERLDDRADTGFGHENPSTVNASAVLRFRYGPVMMNFP